MQKKQGLLLESFNVVFNLLWRLFYLLLKKRIQNIQMSFTLSGLISL